MLVQAGVHCLMSWSCSGAKAWKQPQCDPILSFPIPSRGGELYRGGQLQLQPFQLGLSGQELTLLLEELQLHLVTSLPQLPDLLAVGVSLHQVLGILHVELLSGQESLCRGTTRGIHTTAQAGWHCLPKKQ